ncbi:MAG: VanZ family protein [Treponema sp.]|nr:VanZ family protein [Treponema sp.]
MNRTASTILKVLRWVPAVFIGCCSWYLSSQPHVPLPDFQLSDKVVHLVCFAGFAFFTAIAFFGLKPLDGRRITAAKRILLPAVVISLYGIIDEIHQSYVPGRSCSFLDWCADTIGAIIGSSVFYFLVKALLTRNDNVSSRT